MSDAHDSPEPAEKDPIESSTVRGETTPEVGYRAMGVLIRLCWVAFPFLWFFRRIPDTKEGFHFTWNAGWIALPIVLAFVRKVKRDMAKDKGLPYPPTPALAQLGNKLLLSWVMMFLFVLGIEAVLKLARYERDFPPIVYQVKGGDGEVINSREGVVTHPLFIIALTPGKDFRGITVNSLGYREREISPEKAPNTTRVIHLGDSIVAQGRPPFSQLLQQRMDEVPPGEGDWESFHMAVHGYSSSQGLSVFNHQAKGLKPDYVTIYFGPNDRNVARDGRPDSSKIATKAANRTSAYLMEKMQSKRLGQLILGMSQDLARARAASSDTLAEGADEIVFRVAADEYRYNLETMVREARAIDCTPILMTIARRDLSEGLVTSKNAFSVEAATKRHDAYNDIVREVAAEHDVALIDLAKLLAAPESDHFFAPDGVHFDNYSREGEPDADKLPQPGLSFIAEAIHAKIKEIEAK